ncbi:TDP-N-acetylfucosamine:lipid II N-acetylfucosaminyltransferase [Pontimicrobium sp. SW4]|uniref:TDP-N-acetylfucosamine:lipid II N-acetylfucosaminyltransferase n=1 Tax=Pontimicrobium sp. SW4 TaxID=3153519 RepID=A0AAU7BS78_9FLAO
MIVHLFDDEKFVDATIKKFEEIESGINRYIVFSNSQNLIYSKNIDKIEVHTNKWYKLDFNFIFQDCSLLVIHYLTPLKTFILKNMPKSIPVLWMVWGGDAYSYFKNFVEYEVETNKLTKKQLKTKVRNSLFYDLYYKLRYGVRTINKEKNALQNINYLSTVLPPEFNLIKSEFNLNVSYIKFNYDSFNNIFYNKNEHSLGKNILLGNSATQSNNHLDIFKKIESVESLLIVPLNYGDNKYSKIIIKEGFKKYRNNFNPLTEFLQLEEYQKIILSCNTMIMYHIRQQALGNILVALFLGIRVFLNKKSITYDYLKSIGLKVFSLEDDIKFLGKELNDGEKKINAKLVVDYWGEEKILEGTSNVIGLYHALKK